MDFIQELRNYVPFNDQEASDKKMMLRLIDEKGYDILSRKNETAHFSASSLILNENLDKVLMIYHNIYQSWSWTGGHADEETDMLKVAMNEAREETGITNVKLYSDGLFAIDNLPVWGHYKNGEYVSTHIHCNFTYLLVADENQKIQPKEDENSGVKWIKIKDLQDMVEEKPMMKVYSKLLREIKGDFKWT